MTDEPLTEYVSAGPTQVGVHFEIDSLSDPVSWAAAERLLADTEAVEIVINGSGEAGSGKILRFIDQAHRAKKLSSLTIKKEVSKALAQSCKRFEKV